jgi:hypothetical protein
MRIFGFEITRVKKESIPSAGRPRLENPRPSPKSPKTIQVGPVKPTPQSPAPLAEEQILFKTIATDHCPDCGSGEGFFKGPRGGISMNIKCANPSCGSKFNVTPALEIADRI